MSLDLYFYIQRGKGRQYVYDRNITHNLNRMADALGVYKCLWRPEENGFDRAKQIKPLVQKALEELTTNEKKYTQYNASNGWGITEHFKLFLSDVLTACNEYPNAKIEASR